MLSIKADLALQTQQLQDERPLVPTPNQIATPLPPFIEILEPPVAVGERDPGGDRASSLRSFHIYQVLPSASLYVPPEMLAVQ